MTEKLHGGAREGAGRKPQLKEPIKVLIVLEKSHSKQLGQLAKKLMATGEFTTASGLRREPSRSEVVRYLLDNYSFA